MNPCFLRSLVTADRFVCIANDEHPRPEQGALQHSALDLDNSFCLLSSSLFLSSLYSNSKGVPSHSGILAEKLLTARVVSCEGFGAAMSRSHVFPVFVV